MPDASVRITAKTLSLKGILSPYVLEAEAARARAEVADDAEIVFASFALHRTGRMARGIHTVHEGDDLIVETEARDPITGFDYVRITRFGHRTFHIVPLHRSPASVIATGKRRKKGRMATLRWVGTDGGVIYRHSSKGFHPTTDWASEALPEIRVRAQRRMSGLARRVEVAWEGS